MLSSNLSAFILLSLCVLYILVTVMSRGMQYFVFECYFCRAGINLTLLFLHEIKMLCFLQEIGKPITAQDFPSTVNFFFCMRIRDSLYMKIHLFRIIKLYTALNTRGS